jgi:hypothetical protein
MWSNLDTCLQIFYAIQIIEPMWNTCGASNMNQIVGRQSELITNYQLTSSLVGTKIEI